MFRQFALQSKSKLSGESRLCKIKALCAALTLQFSVISLLKGKPLSNKSAAPLDT